MAEAFDPYHQWLGIPPHKQPADYYRLLGVKRFEPDPSAIEAAADERTGLLRAYTTGERSGLAVKLLNEISVAKVCLLNPNRRTGYDRGLREQLEAEAKKADQAERARSERFLAILQEKDLLPAGLIEDLRKQLAQSEKAIPATAVAKRLIGERHLTSAIAERLLAAAAEQGSAASAPPTSAPKAPRPAKQAEESKRPPPTYDDDDLDFAPLDDGPAARRRATKRKSQPAAKPEPPAEKAPPKQPAAKAPSKQSAEKTPSKTREKQAEAPPVQTPKPPAPPTPPPGSLLDEELRPPSAGPAAGTGPLDGLMADSDLDAAAAGGLLTTAPKRKGLRGLFTRSKKIGEKTNVWDSSLLLIGGGTLLALLILGSVLIWALGRQTGDQALGQADEDYRDGRYAQAIHKYGLYLEKFPNHSGVSIARVNCGLAKLRQKTARGTSDWSTALQAAKEVLQEIRPEAEFKQAHGDLSVMLLAIAEGLAAKARQTPDRALVAQSQEALELLNLNVPKSLRRGDKMADVEASLALTVRDITRGEELDKAIAAIKKAIAAGDTQQAYAIRKTLLKQYPLLAPTSGNGDAQLKQVVLEISRAQREAAKWVQQQQPGDVAEPATSLLSTVALARRTTTTSVPGVDGQVVFAMAAGAAYGLDAATGKVLWRRYLGFADNGRSTGFAPTPVSSEPGSDALLVDPVRNEVLRVEAATGNLRWRHPIGERFDAHPVIAGNRILVATRSRRLVILEAATGDSSGYIHLPQSLDVAPAVDPSRSLVFQIADHSNLFVLGLDDGACKAVVYLGHELGGVTAPPVVVSRFLIVAVNSRTHESLLRIFTIADPDQGLSVRPVQQFRLPGHVDTAPLVVGRKVLVATDTGAASVFEISGTDEKKPLGIVAESTALGKENLIRFPLMQGGQLWMADAQLTMYEIQASRGQLVPKWVMDEDSVFQQPLVAIGPAIFHVRRKVGMPGVLVSAVATNERTRYWETHLAVPLPVDPTVDTASRSITAVTSIGGVFQVDASGLKGRSVVDEPLAAMESSELNRPLSDVVRLGAGLLAMSAGEGSDRIAVYDPRRQPKPFQLLQLPDALACPPIAFGGGLLAPLKVGRALLLDPRTGDQQTEPFEPPLESGVTLAWRLPAVAGEHGAVLADGRSKLYRLAVADQPKPHLAAPDQVEVSEPIVSPVAVVGDLVYAVDAANVLAAFRLPKLTRVEEAEQLLGGRCVWGPQRVGNHVMLSTDERLLCLDGSGKLRWQVDLPHGPLAGTPLETGAHYILAATGGVVWRADAASGKELGKIETGRPLGTGPVLLGTQLLLGGHDGSLYRVQQPEAE